MKRSELDTKKRGLETRISKLRVQIYALPLTEDSTEKRQKLTNEVSTLEGEIQAVHLDMDKCDEADKKAEKRSDGLTPEEKELRGIQTRARLDRVFKAAMTDSRLDGAELELRVESHKGT